MGINSWVYNFFFNTLCVSMFNFIDNLQSQFYKLLTVEKAQIQQYSM